MQASEEEMEKLLPGVLFSRLATSAKMGKVCALHHGLPVVHMEQGP